MGNEWSNLLRKIPASEEKATTTTTSIMISERKLLWKISNENILWKETTSANVFLSLSLSLCSFHGISFHKFSQQLSVSSLCSSGLISALLVLSTTYLFTKVSFSPDVIICGWLGLKHQLTNERTHCRVMFSAASKDIHYGNLGCVWCERREHTATARESAEGECANWPLSVGKNSLARPFNPPGARGIAHKRTKS